MNRLIRFLIFFICSVIILLAVITALLPSSGKVVKQKDINAGEMIVSGELKNMRNYTLWYPWLQMDPEAVVKYTGEEDGFSWVSTTAENNFCTYQITGSEGDSILHFRLAYGNVPPVTGAYILRPSADSSSVTLIWYMTMEAGWKPWWRFYGAMMDKLNGPLLETGLTNLKVICEKQMPLPGQ